MPNAGMKTSADPAKTSALQQSISDWPLSSKSYFAGVKTRLASFVERGQLGPFANAYWGHPAYRLPPEANLLAVAHYLEALDWQRRLARERIDGRLPHDVLLLLEHPAVITLGKNAKAENVLASRAELAANVRASAAAAASSQSMAPATGACTIGSSMLNSSRRRRSGHISAQFSVISCLFNHTAACVT